MREVATIVTRLAARLFLLVVLATGGGPGVRGAFAGAAAEPTASPGAGGGDAVFVRPDPAASGRAAGQRARRGAPSLPGGADDLAFALAPAPPGLTPPSAAGQAVAAAPLEVGGRPAVSPRSSRGPPRF